MSTFTLGMFFFIAGVVTTILGDLYFDSIKIMLRGVLMTVIGATIMLLGALANLVVLTLALRDKCLREGEAKARE